LSGFFKILGSANLDFLPNPFEDIKEIQLIKDLNTLNTPEYIITSTDNDINLEHEITYGFEAPKRFKELELSSCILMNSGA
jgi:hypothetical protein